VTSKAPLSKGIKWDYPEPFVIHHCAQASEADGYGHINNSVYLSWLDRCVWEHCEKIGLGPKFCRSIDRGMAVSRHQIDYLSSAYPGDEVMIANWVTFNDARLRCERKFQIVRINDGATLLRAHSFYISTRLSSGRPCRMPTDFIEGFAAISKS